MATTQAPYGLRPVGLVGGRAYTGALKQIKIASGYATNIFFGDVVKLSGGTIQKDGGTTTATPVGVFLGCTYTDPTLGFVTRQYWPSGTVASDAYALICDDPDAVFQVQASGSVASTAIGKNAGFVQNAGSTATGNSKVALDYTTVAAPGAALPLKIVGFVEGPFSTAGDAFTDVLVTWNAGMHAYRNATGVA